MRSRFLIIAIAASWVFAVGFVRADPALECQTSGVAVVNISSAEGWSFMTNDPITIDALDAYNVTGSTGDVRLYDSSGTTLASAIVTTSDPIEGSPIGFYSHPITPVNLLAGETYFVAEDIAQNATRYIDGATGAVGITTDPAITYDGAVSGVGEGLNPLTDAAFRGVYGVGYFGPNFDIAPVPEPSGIALLGMAAMGLVGAVRRKRLAETA